MPTYRLAAAAALLGVSDDTVRRWADTGRLPVTTDAGGRRVVEGTALAAFAVAQAGEPEGSRHSSARNRFEGIVTRVVRGDVVSQVEVQSGPHRLVSIVSTEAVDALGLEPGAPAVASVKSTNVVVELP
ncbi:MAG: TOBE domain-containing protein [Mycobacteriales bacterium]|nr:TOBE domain-containing protein [Mycobacteriales bacterium]